MKKLRFFGMTVLLLCLFGGAYAGGEYWRSEATCRWNKKTYNSKAHVVDFLGLGCRQKSNGCGYASARCSGCRGSWAEARYGTDPASGIFYANVSWRTNCKRTRSGTFADLHLDLAPFFDEPSGPQNQDTLYSAADVHSQDLSANDAQRLIFFNGVGATLKIRKNENQESSLSFYGWTNQEYTVDEERTDAKTFFSRTIRLTDAGIEGSQYLPASGYTLLDDGVYLTLQITNLTFSAPIPVQVAFDDVNIQVSSDGGERMAAVLRKAEGYTTGLTSSEQKFRLGPNPCTTELGLTVTPDRSSAIRVLLYTADGKKAAVLYDGPVAAGEALSKLVDVAPYPRGLYYITVTGLDERPLLRKVVLE